MEEYQKVGEHNVRVFEQGHGSPLLFLYDTWHSSLAAGPVSGLLGNAAHVVAVDPPAFARSKLPEEYKLTLKDYTTFLVKAVDLAGPSNVTLVLCDIGIPLAFATLADQETFAGKLGRVVILNGPLYPDQLLGFKGLKRSSLFNRWDLPMNRMIHRRRILGLHGEPSGLDEVITEEAWSAFRGGDYSAQFRLLKELGESGRDLETGMKALGDSGLPILILWGEDDPSDDGSHIRRVEKDLPQAETYLLPQVGHFPHLEAREVVADAIRGFLHENGERRAIEPPPEDGA